VTALDTNILVALWDRNPSVHVPVRQALDNELESGGLVICAPVYAELRAGPGRTDTFLEEFLVATGIEADWDFPALLWRAAGAAFQRHAAARSSAARPRRILADFLIGAHAEHRCGRLLTLDAKLFEKSFPGLSVITA